MKDKLINELAHSGIFFWLPLLSCPDEPAARRSAHTGLWLLIVGTVSNLGIRILSSVNSAFPHGLLHILVSGVYSLAFMFYVLGMLYLGWKNVKAVLAIHQGQEHNEFPFFSEHAIIR